MTENSGRILEALDHLDPALMEDMDGQTTVKRRSAPVRVLLVAACVGALLVTAVVAAEALGFDFVRIFGSSEEKTVYVKIRGDDSTEEWEEMGLLYEVYGSGNMKNIPLRELSPAIQEIQEQYKDEDWYGENLAFDSWEEAEEYIGRELADNALLAQAEYTRLQYGPEPHVEGNCIVGPFFTYGELSSMDVAARYSLPYPNAKMGEINNIIMEVEADLYIGYDLPMNPDYAFIDNGYWAVAGQESYLTVNGLEAVIIDVKDVRDGEIQSDGSYHAFFFLRGVRFKLKVGYWGDRAEPILTTLKQVLDAYQ